MINLITGVPGAGKTYLAVKFIYENLTSKNPKYKSVFTNINLDFKKCDKIKKGYVKSLNLDDFLQRIEKDYELSELFKNNQLFDEETGELITDYDSYVRDKLKLFEPYKHSLIILDECHLYFTSSTDDKLLRFLSYHRHFDIDMYFITQNKSLINRKYLAFVENMYVGQNPSKRLFKKVFVYKLYASYVERKENYVGKEKYKFDLKIANLYNSGSTKINKTFSLRLILPVIILSLIVLFGFIAFKNYLTCGSVFGCSKHIQKSNVGALPHTSKFTENTQINKSHFVQNSYSDVSDYQFYYKIVCFKYKCIANTKYDFSRNFLDFLKKHSKVFVDEISFPFETLYIATNFDLSKFQGGKSESNSSNSFFGD